MSSIETVVVVSSSRKSTSIPVVATRQSNHDFEENGPMVGYGQYGKVYKIRSRTDGKLYARKDIEPKSCADSHERDKLIHAMAMELELLMTLRHTHIVSYVFHSTKTDMLRIYTEFCDGGDLHTRMNPQNQKYVYSEKFTWNVLLAVSSALSLCHHGLRYGKGEDDEDLFLGFEENWFQVIHRDIKPGNIFLATPTGPRPRAWLDYDDDNVIVKLGDFGTACRLQDGSSPSTYGGTKLFWAPELEEQALLSCRITNWSTKSDIWSVGATLYRLLTGQAPRKAAKLPSLNEKITFLKEELDKQNVSVPPVLIRVTCECLDMEPSNRPTALDLLAVCLKAFNSPVAVRRNYSFWKALAMHSEKGEQAREIVAPTADRFLRQYLDILDTTFSEEEACLLMSLQSICSVGECLTSAVRLRKGIYAHDPGATILHAAANVTTKDPYLRRLTWDVTSWPNNASLSQLSLRRDNNGLFASSLAAFNGDKQVTKYLLDIEEQARKKEAAREKERATEMARSDLAAHAKGEIEFLYLLLRKDDTRPWIINTSHASRALAYAAGKGYEVVVRKLLEIGVNISGRSGKRRETALHCAAGSGRLEVVRTLLEMGANIASQDDRQRVPLHIAAWNGHEAIVRLLLENGSYIEAPDELGRTPLYGAAGYGHIGVVRLLLDHGADANARGGRNKGTAVEWADRMGQEAVINLLCNHLCILPAVISETSAADSDGDGNGAEEDHTTLATERSERGFSIA